MVPPRVMLLVGAPPFSSVDEASCTLNTLDPRIARFLDIAAQRAGESPSQHDEENSSSRSVKIASWRSLSLHPQPALRTAAGFSQVHHHHLAASASPPAGYFFTTADVSAFTEDEARDVLTQFCEESLAAHDPAMRSSSPPQVQDSADPSFTSVVVDESDSSLLLTDSLSASRINAPHALLLPATTTTAATCHLSDLEDVPPPSHIHAAMPSTITVNLIAGVLSLAQPRTVTTRWGRRLSLVEVLVGDDTRAGFAVTFWLSSGGIPHAQLARYRRQDVVLLRNVALHVFRGKVYGQSLRKGLTQMGLLWRADGSGFYSNRALDRPVGEDPQVDKTRKTRDWVRHFVGADPSLRAGSKKFRKSWDQPPEDTQ